MNPFAAFACRRHAALPVLRLWLVFAACLGAAALQIAALQRIGAALSARLTSPPVLYATTFADAAGSLRAGRHAEAYGRFVALADEGDVDAARIALVMHRYGPELFGSEWDASGEQLAAWTAESEAAARRDLAIPGGRPQP
jgi:hypothetical protein